MGATDNQMTCQENGDGVDHPINVGTKFDLYFFTGLKKNDFVYVLVFRVVHIVAAIEWVKMLFASSKGW